MSAKTIAAYGAAFQKWNWFIKPILYAVLILILHQCCNVNPMLTGSGSVGIEFLQKIFGINKAKK